MVGACHTHPKLSSVLSDLEAHNHPIERHIIMVQLSYRKWATIFNIYVAHIRSAGITTTFHWPGLQVCRLTFIGPHPFVGHESAQWHTWWTTERLGHRSLYQCSQRPYWARTNYLTPWSSTAKLLLHKILMSGPVGAQSMSIVKRSGERLCNTEGEHDHPWWEPRNHANFQGQAYVNFSDTFCNFTNFWRLCFLERWGICNCIYWGIKTRDNCSGVVK